MFVCSNKLFFKREKIFYDFSFRLEMRWKMIFLHLRGDFHANESSKKKAINCQKAINFLASFIMWKLPIDTKTDNQFNLLCVGELICECWFWCGVNGQPRLKIFHELIKKDSRKASNNQPDYGRYKSKLSVKQIDTRFTLRRLPYRLPHTHNLTIAEHKQHFKSQSIEAEGLNKTKLSHQHNFGE